MNSQLKIEFLKVAKKMNISMTRSCEEIVEFHCSDEGKSREFVKAIKAINKDTRVVDLIYSNQYTDINGWDIRNSKAKYLVDDDYYRELIGQGKLEQISMF